METLLQVAKDTGSNAVHPGYGFLSENSKFQNLL
jgi:acetyl/propionyl-CoA carboxylase alpha subunit